MISGTTLRTPRFQPVLLKMLSRQRASLVATLEEWVAWVEDTENRVSLGPPTVAAWVVVSQGVWEVRAEDPVDMAEDPKEVWAAKVLVDIQEEAAWEVVDILEVWGIRVVDLVVTKVAWEVAMAAGLEAPALPWRCQRNYRALSTNWFDSTIME